MINKITSLCRLFLALSILLLVPSCIENDIPYPTIPLSITKLQVKGQLGSSVINTEDRSVTVTLADTVNLKKVHIEELEMTQGAQSILRPDTALNLTNPLSVDLSLYQTYTWKIVGKQTIERRFSVEGQIGESIFDPQTKRAIAYVTTATDLQNIRITDLKLGPTGSMVTPDHSLLTDFRSRKTVIVMFRDVMEEWSLYVFQKAVEASTLSADGWVHVGWLYGEGKEGSENGFEIREANSETWTKVDARYITHVKGKFTARVPNLKPATAYVCRAYSGDHIANEVPFNTTTAIELPNGSFDDWHKAGKVWNPWLESGTGFWDSGNKGSSTLGESNTQPSTEVCSAGAGGNAAKLESRFVGLGSLGKFAAGNIFVGTFVKVDGTNGIIDFGKPFTSYPTRVKGYYKYTSAPINYASSEFQALKGLADTCTIYAALGDWDSPVEIRTRPENRKLFDKNDPRIIAYAEFNSGVSVSEYQPINLELEYRATNRKPTYLILVCSASKYGDYFTGGTGSTLFVDEFTLEYDY